MKKRCSGFTLIELLIYSGVLCILLMISIRVSVDLYQKKHADIIANDIKSAIRYARNVTFDNDVPMTLSPLPDTRDWSMGMILHTDKDKIVYQWQWNYAGVRVAWRGFRSNNYITFSPVLRQSTANGHFNIVTTRQYKKELIVNRLGHVR